MSQAFIQERITQTKLIIVSYENAIQALTGAGAIESYTLDTGQSRQTVTRNNLKELNETLDGLYNRLTVLEARCSGNGSVLVRPAW